MCELAGGVRKSHGSLHTLAAGIVLKRSATHAVRIGRWFDCVIRQSGLIVTRFACEIKKKLPEGSGKVTIELGLNRF